MVGKIKRILSHNDSIYDELLSRKKHNSEANQEQSPYLIFDQHERLCETLYSSKIKYSAYHCSLDIPITNKLNHEANQLRRLSIKDEVDLKPLKSDGYKYTDLSAPSMIKKIKRSRVHSHYLEVKKDSIFTKLCSEVSLVPEIKKIIGFPYVIYNIRAWFTSSGSTLPWHYDSFVPGTYKIMIYPQPMNLDYGYLAIKGKDKVYKVKANQPSVLIFDNNRLQHRAFSPRDSLRLDHPPQSFSSSPSSIEIIGYFLANDPK